MSTDVGRLNHRVLCVSGNASDPCGCPDGFRRYGTRCYGIPDQKAKNWLDAMYECANSFGGELAAPRSQAEHDQMALAAAELQTGPLQMLWLDVTFKRDIEEWSIDDPCKTTTQMYWAAGQPGDSRGPLVAYAPPGMEQPTGWYARGSSALHPGLCQLNLCYRPDCPQ